MKKSLLCVSIITLWFGLNATTVFADDDYIPFSAVPLATVVANLQAQGYKDIRKIKFDDGVYKAEVINDQGQKVKLRINPQTGKVNPQARMHQSISMLDAIKKVQTIGYQRIYKVEFEHGVYKIEARDKQSEKVKVTINSQSGQIIRTKRDDDD